MLRETTLLFVKTARWRYNIPGGHVPIRRPSYEWSRDGRSWQTLHIDIRVSVIRGTGAIAFNFSPDVSRELETLMASGSREPVYHELLREARSQGHGNERSALVLAVAAIESGIKQLISDLVPDASWLMDEVQTPPVFDMIREYLPEKLGARVRNAFPGGRTKPPNKVLTALNNAIGKRNKVVHGRESEVDRQFVADSINAAWDLLWMFDYYRGYTWASDHLSQATCKDLGIEYRRPKARIDVSLAGDSTVVAHLVRDVTAEENRPRTRARRQPSN